MEHSDSPLPNADVATGRDLARIGRLLGLSRSKTRVHAIKAEDDEPLSESDFSGHTACSGATGPEGSPVRVPSSKVTLDALKICPKERPDTPDTGTPSSTDSAEDSEEDAKDSVNWKIRKVSPLTAKVVWWKHDGEQRACSGRGHSPVRSAPVMQQSSRSHSPPKSAASATHILHQSSRNDAPARTASSACSTAMPAHGSHPSAADTVVMRAANGVAASRSMSAPVPSMPEVDVCDSEKQFILSLSDVPAESEILPPLLGYEPPPEIYGPLVGPYAANTEGDDLGTCVVPLGLKKTLVLDLDETLVASTRTPVSCDFKVVFRIQSKMPKSGEGCSVERENKDGSEKENREAGEARKVDSSTAIEAPDADDGPSEICYYVRLRPGLREFLEGMAELYELVVWTASGKAYADAILDLLDPDGNFFVKRLYREACVRHRGLCVKDLRRLGRPMNSVVLLDNFVYSFGFTLDNGLPIAPWTGVEGANESGLVKASTLLFRLARVSDVRAPLIKTFDLHRHVHGERPTCVTPRVLPLPKSEENGVRLSRHASRGRSGCLSPGRSRWISGSTSASQDRARARTPKSRTSRRDKVLTPPPKEYEPLLASSDDELME